MANHHVLTERYRQNCHARDFQRSVERVHSKLTTTGMNSVPMNGKPVVARIVTCGEASVGKTSLLKRMMKDVFSEQEPPTIGSEYLRMDFSKDGRDVQLQIWDTAGEERYRGIMPLYFRNSIGALLVFDITDRQSLTQLEDWLTMYRDCNGDATMLFVVANKIDLMDETCEATREEAYIWCKSKGFPLYETSAKTGEGVQMMISDVCEKIIVQKQAIKQHRPSDVMLTDESESKKCC